MTILTVRHHTRYRYRRPVAFGEHRLMFRPGEGPGQRVIAARLEIVPRPILTRTVQDIFGNVVTCVRFEGQAQALSFNSFVRLDHWPLARADEAEEVFPIHGAPFLYPVDDTPDLARALTPAYVDPTDEVQAWARRFAPANGRGRVGEALIAMTQAIHEGFSYEERLTGPPRAPLETLTRGSGACRDFAVLMIEAVRRLGLAARFVSGYLYAAPGRVGGGHTHAWVQVYLPSQGWLDFDPTNGIVDGQGLIRVAVAVDPRHALPLQGLWYGRSDDHLGLEIDVEVASEAELKGAAPVEGQLTAVG